MANLTACQDVIIWAIDLKKGMELGPWQECLDRYYSPGLLHRGPPFCRLGSGGLGGFELGVVVVPSGAGLVAAAPS